MITEAEFEALLLQCQTSAKPIPTEYLTEAEQRRERRWQGFHLSATLYFRGGEYAFPVLDLSLTGIRLGYTSSSLEIGERVILILPFDGLGTLAVNAEIVHCRPTASGPSTGLKFLPHCPEELLPLITYLGYLWEQEQSNGRPAFELPEDENKMLKRSRRNSQS